MGRLVVVSNRLPVTVTSESGSLEIQQSVGGLATGLSGFYEQRDSIWIGWPGLPEEACTPEDRDTIHSLLKERRCEPVFLSQRQLDEYYNGFCNQTLWPLCHYFPSFAIYRESYWDAYQEVNQRFCDAVLAKVSSEDTIWVHDYHLFLLPGLLRQRLPDARIGFFLHIPFPSSEIIRLLPWREHLLQQLIGADLIGFHTYDYVRHFLASIRGVLGYAPIAVGKTVIPVDKRVVRADAFAMGIDVAHFEHLAEHEDTQREVHRIRNEIGDRKVILSIDRLDYSKGMLLRLKAFERFLEEYPAQRGQVTLVLKAIASRSGIAKYDELKRLLDEAVGRINGRFGTLDWVPVWYLFHFLPEETLAALYRLSDVALLTPLRDGMNLIAKEYLASKPDGDGVLILSELAGVAQELREALIVNPNNEREISNAIATALAMPSAEQQNRMSMMRDRIRHHDVIHWAIDFVESLDEIKHLQDELKTTKLQGETRARLLDAYRSAASRLIVLDDDGTLIELADHPDLAQPSDEIKDILRQLCQDPANDVAIISGRGRDVLSAWFGDLHLRLGAEHGVWARNPGASWRLMYEVPSGWQDDVQAILNLYARRTPGARVDEKEFSLVWDTRGIKPEFAEVRSGELLADLDPLLQIHSLDVLKGEGFIEVKRAGISETELIRQWQRDRPHEFVFSAGDDASDEGVFLALPESAYTVRIGPVPSRARFSLPSPTELLALLSEMSHTKSRSQA